MNGHNEYMALENAKARIREWLGPEELLCQLAEEACELAHAALKLRRALDGTNPTPVDCHTATDKLKEGVADVALLCELLALDQYQGEIRAIMDYKTKRWEGRLKEKE